MIDLDLKPDTKKLKQFGYICFFGFGLFGLIVAHRMGALEGSGKWTIPLILWALGIICPLLALAAPKGLTPLYLALMILAFPIGLVLSNVVLMIIFFGIFTPLAIWFRIRGRDELHREWSSEAPSYWIPYRSPQDVESYYRQF